MKTLTNLKINTPLYGYILAVIAAVLFSSKPIFIKFAYSYGIDTVSLMLIRMLLAVPIYILIAILLIRKNPIDLRQKPQKISFIQALMVGLFGYYLASLLDLAGLQYINAQLERMLLYTYPSFVAILAALFFKQKITRKQVFALLLCYSGISLLFFQDVSVQGQEVLFGGGLILLSAASYALYLLLSKKYISLYGSLLFTCISMVSASVATIIHALISMQFEPLTLHNIEFSLPLISSIIGLTIFATIIPTFMISEAVKQIGATNTGLIGTLGPVITTLLAVLILSEDFTLLHAAGMSIIIIAIYALKPAKK